MQIFRYFMVGGLAASVDLLIFLPLLYCLDLTYLTASAMSFIAATMVNYRLSIAHVFNPNSRFSPKTEMFAVYVVSGIGLAINQAAIFACVELLQMYVLLAKVVSMVIVFFWNYLSRKHFIFASKVDNYE